MSPSALLLLLPLLACQSEAPPTEAPAAAAVVSPPKEADAPPIQPQLGDSAMMDAWMVIAAGSTDKAEAQQKFESYQAAGHYAASGYPQLLESEMVDGLKPGFWIVVPAVVQDEGSAKAIVAHLKQKVEGPYMRPVRVMEALDLKLALRDGELVTAAPAPPPFAAWSRQGQACQWSLHEGSGPAKTLALLPVPCQQDVVITPGPKGQAAVVMSGTGFLVDTKKQESRPLPSFSGDHSLESVGFSEGSVLALTSASWELEVVDRDADEAHLVFQGTKHPISMEYAADFQLCLSHRLKGEAWVQEDADAFGVMEGVSPPFCARISRLAEAYDDPAISSFGEGGHGEFGWETLEQEDLPEPFRSMGGAYGSWGQRSIGGGVFAAQITLLEGQHTSAPLLMERGGSWQALEGFEKPGTLVISERDGFLLACGDKHSGVYDTGSGERLWSGETPCPLWWPPGLTP